MQIKPKFAKLSKIGTKTTTFYKLVVNFIKLLKFEA